MHGFTRFGLAAGELPITGIGLAGRAGAEKHLVVFANQHADGNIHNLVFTHVEFLFYYHCLA